MARNDTAYKWWSCHSVHKLLCKLCRTFPPPPMEARFTVFLASRPCGLAGWLALLLIKAGDVETNSGPTTLRKRVWICNICYKQIHVRKQISIRCNTIEHCVHIRYAVIHAVIRQAQYTDTWTCHLHREYRLTTHTDIIPPHPYRPLSQPHTHPTYTTATKTQTHVQHSPCSHRIGKAQTKSSHPLIPLSTHVAPSQTHTHITYSTNSFHPTHHTHP